MKKILTGIFALFVAVIVPAASVCAIADDPLDYANSIGQISESDTVNMVVEATSDGGYLVGGQLIKCYKRPRPTVIVKDEDDDEDEDEDEEEDDEWVNTSLDECLAHQGPQYRDLPSAKLKSLGNTMSVSALMPGGIFNVCSSGEITKATGSLSSEEEYVYYSECMDYVAKFKKDGTREWIETVEDDSEIEAVGETPNDYRMLTKEGTIYTFNKSGELSSEFDIDYDYSVYAAEFDADGMLYIIDEALFKFNLDGELIASLPTDTSSDVYYYAPSIIMNGDIYAMREVYNEATDSYDYKIVKVSKDFSTVVDLVDGGDDDSVREVVSADKDGNFMVIHCISPEITTQAEGDSDDDDCYCALETYDKNGDLINEIKVDYDSFYYYWANYEFYDDFVIYDLENGKITKYNKNLEVIFEYGLEEGESLNDFVELTDGSMVGVGRSTQSTDNYDVEGSQNGIQLRFDAVVEGIDEPVDGTTNPATVDNIWMIVLTAIVMMGGVAFGAKRLACRRLGIDK